MTRAAAIQTDETYMTLWVNECYRVFHDRLVDAKDRQWFQDIIMELLERNFQNVPEKAELFS